LETNKFIDSKFRMVILAAKRARQLLQGGRKKIDMNAENPLTIAIEELNRGLVGYEITDGSPRKPDLSIFGDAPDENETDEVDAGVNAYGMTKNVSFEKPDEEAAGDADEDASDYDNEDEDDSTDDSDVDSDESDAESLDDVDEDVEIDEDDPSALE